MLKLYTHFRLEYPLVMNVMDNTLFINKHVFHLEDLKKRNDFRPFCRYVFSMKQIPFVGPKGQIVPHDFVWNYEGKDILILPIAEPFERYSTTYNSKHNNYEPNYFVNVVSVVFYPETKNFKDAMILIPKAKDGVPQEIMIADDEKGTIPYVPDFEGPLLDNQHLLPKCLLDGDETVDIGGGIYEFTYRNIDGVPVSVDFQATAKTDKGYISHQKFDVVKGKGRFKFIPFGLDKGEVATVQVGIGKYSDVVKKEIMIV